MTKQAKSNEEIYKLLAESLPEHLVEFIKEDDGQTIAVESFRVAEKKHLPIINQQAEEIEKLKGQGVTTLNDYREEVKMRLEAQTERDNLLQEIEKLKAELSTVKANDRFRTELSVNNRIITKRRLFEVMQKECPENGEEVDKISEDDLIKAIESYIWDMRVELITKNDALQSRFDELVKSLEGVDKWSLDDVKLRGSDELVESRAIQSILRKAKEV